MRAEVPGLRQKSLKNLEPAHNPSSESMAISRHGNDEKEVFNPQL
jgi:hypothetical protein